jgi:uncharacterized protein (TIGR02246 family)
MTRPNPRPNDADTAAIRRLYDALMRAWNDGDAAAFAAAFHEDGDLVGFDGTHLRGRDTIREFHDQLFHTYVAGTRLVGFVRSVRFLDAGVAVMHAEGGTVMPDAREVDPERNSIQTMVATSVDGAWRLAAFQNTRVLLLGRPELVERLTAELNTSV